jgi:hypothetical protein
MADREKVNVPVQSLIDHIKTATDVDPWAKEMAEELLKEQEPLEPFHRCIDRDKAIAELQEYHDREWTDERKQGVPARDERRRITGNALDLLKEQEATWVEYPECLKYENAYSTDHIVCSACQYVFSTIDNCTEEFMHCPHCGAKMI